MTHPESDLQRINVKPLSVNEAWQGKRFKTDKYNTYEKLCLLVLKPFKLPEPPYEVLYRFGFSNAASDLANPEKCITDILCKKYNFNDKHIHRMILEKVIVPKGSEFIEFRIASIKP